MPTTAYIVGNETLITHRALAALLSAAEDNRRLPGALFLTRQAWDPKRIETVEDRTTMGAIAKILGEPLPPLDFRPAIKPADRQRFEILAKAWLTWASGGDPTPLLKEPGGSGEYGGAIHLMVLEPWANAIRSLSRKDLIESRRFYDRSIELGTQCSTETTTVIQWTYVASFHNLA